MHWILVALALFAGCDTTETDDAIPDMTSDVVTKTDLEVADPPDDWTDVESVPLLDPAALKPVEADADPLHNHRPAEVDCPVAAWGPEGGGFEIQTGVCNYAAFDQALPIAINEGDALQIILWHDFLDAAEPATAHVAVWLDTTVVWETEVSIPGFSKSFDVIVPIDWTPSPDARLGVHLHNHGFNSWRVVSVDRLAR